MFIVIYRPHGVLHIETKHFGPFTTHEAAYDYLCSLPAIGQAEDGEEDGCKYTEELENPDGWQV